MADAVLMHHSSPIACTACKELPRFMSWNEVCGIHREAMTKIISGDKLYTILDGHPARAAVPPALMAHIRAEQALERQAKRDTKFVEPKMEVIRLKKHLDIRNASDGPGNLGG